MTEECEMCGATEKIQRHHISYEPEIIQFLCVNCHKKVHGHGVGTVGFKGTGAGLLNSLREEIIMLCEAGATNKEIAKLIGVGKTTVSRWKKRLGFKGMSKIDLPKRKRINVYLPSIIEIELWKIAQQENKELEEQHKTPNMSKAQVATRIVEDWFQKRVDAEKLLRETYGLTGEGFEALEKETEQ